MVALGVDVDPIRGIADTGRFADDLAALFEVLGETSRDLGIGTLALVDDCRRPRLPTSRRSIPRYTTSVRPTSPFDVRRRWAPLTASPAGRGDQLPRAPLLKHVCNAARPTPISAASAEHHHGSASCAPEVPP
jgi:hypothetical protein